MFWKERGEVGGFNVRMKKEDGVLVSGMEEVKSVWKSNFE